MKKKSVDPPQAGAHGPAVDADEQLRRILASKFFPQTLGKGKPQ